MSREKHQGDLVIQMIFRNIPSLLFSSGSKSALLEFYCWNKISKYNESQNLKILPVFRSKIHTFKHTGSNRHTRGHIHTLSNTHSQTNTHALRHSHTAIHTQRQKTDTHTNSLQHTHKHYCGIYYLFKNVHVIKK